MRYVICHVFQKPSIKQNWKPGKKAGLQQDANNTRCYEWISRRMSQRIRVNHVCVFNFTNIIIDDAGRTFFAFVSSLRKETNLKNSNNIFGNLLRRNFWEFALKLKKWRAKDNGEPYNEGREGHFKYNYWKWFDWPACSKLGKY